MAVNTNSGPYSAFYHRLETTGKFQSTRERERDRGRAAWHRRKTDKLIRSSFLFFFSFVLNDHDADLITVSFGPILIC